MISRKHSFRSRKFQDLTGLRFGRWRALAMAGSNKYADSYWHCVCDCGNVAVVRGYCLRMGKSNSCGCLAHELSSLRLSGSRSKHPAEYRIWEGMKKRCLNEKVAAFPYYGGRGVKICPEWLESFDAFLDDMGPKPSPKHQLDRFPDVNGDYKPGNCRWSTRIEQARNKRNNRSLTYNGQTKCLAEWANELGISRAALAKRIDTNGWTLADAMTTEPRSMASHDKITFDGETRTLIEWAEHLGFTYATLHHRIMRGWPVTKILTQSPRAMRRNIRGQCTQ